jgi:hypothetical protein
MAAARLAALGSFSRTISKLIHAASKRRLENAMATANIVNVRAILAGLDLIPIRSRRTRKKAPFSVNFATLSAFDLLIRTPSTFATDARMQRGGDKNPGALVRI